MFCFKKLSKYESEDHPSYGHYNCKYNLKLSPSRNNLCSFKTDNYQYSLYFDNKYEVVVSSSIYDIKFGRIKPLKINLNGLRFDSIFKESIDDTVNKIRELS
jgi:hypothetical protein